jgi:hypothetical protein
MLGQWDIQSHETLESESERERMRKGRGCIQLSRPCFKVTIVYNFGGV